MVEVNARMIDFPIALLVSKLKASHPFLRKSLLGKVLENSITSKGRHSINTLQSSVHDIQNKLSGPIGP